MSAQQSARNDIKEMKVYQAGAGSAGVKEEEVKSRGLRIVRGTPCDESERMVGVLALDIKPDRI